MNSEQPALTASGFAGVVLRQRRAILFVTLALSLAGVYCFWLMPASVFPRTDFPRVVILIDNGVMPADEMMAAVTRPVEEALKDIPGSGSIRSATARGSAEVNVFFDWSTDMIQAELYVLGRLAQIRNQLPRSAEMAVHRLTFSAFPILGISLTSDSRSPTELWELARYELYPRLLRTSGVARIQIVGGRRPEYHVITDRQLLEAHQLSTVDVSRALASSNLFTPAGMHEEDQQLYLAVLDNRLSGPKSIGDVVLASPDGIPVRVRDVARVQRGAAPQYNVVTADGSDAVLLNVYRQPDSNTVAIADNLQRELDIIHTTLPADAQLAFFYDQSLFVRDGLRSVWMRLLGLGFDLMTLGGMAAAIGLVIDDAIVVVESMHTHAVTGMGRARAAVLALNEVGRPLIGSTLTPIVVFIPLAFLDGVVGVFFRALAVTMVLALLTSLVVAVTWTPTLGSLVLRESSGAQDHAEGGPLLRRLVSLYQRVLQLALGHAWLSLLVMVAVVLAGFSLYAKLDSDFLPEQDEGAFVIDYFSRPGTSLSETDRMLRHVELILAEDPDVESESRRTGARLALAIAEPNSGDVLVKLRPERSRSTAEVINSLRARVQAAEPALHTEFPGVLSDLIGDLTWSPNPVEVKLYGDDIGALSATASDVAAALEQVPGVVDVNDGLVVAGPSLLVRARAADTSRAGLTPAAIGDSLRTELLGSVDSHVLRGDRLLDVRVLGDRATLDTREHIADLPLRTGSAPSLLLRDVADVSQRSGVLEMHREDLRQLVSVSARFSGIDMGTGMERVRRQLQQTVSLPPGVSLEYGGTFQQQQESFSRLALVLAMAMVLVFTVLIVEFRSAGMAAAVIAGSALSLVGTLLALLLSGTSFNIVSFLGAIIGVGITAKNGILVLDQVDPSIRRGEALQRALVAAGRRRLRPVLMTSLTTFLGLLPLAWGVGAGADMLRPLAIAVIGALCLSLLLSLVAVPVVYDLLQRLRPRDAALLSTGASESRSSP